MRNFLIRFGALSLSLAAVVGCDSMHHDDMDRTPTKSSTGDINATPADKSMNNPSPSMTPGTPVAPTKDDNDKTPPASK